MRFFSFIAALAMVVFCGYAVWDLKLSEMANPPVPRTEFAKPNAAVSDLLAPHRTALSVSMSSEVIPHIDETLSVIEAEYGAQSPEMVQALGETSIMLAEQGRNDLAVPYMERAENAARAVYGQRHRETAVIQHDLAKLKIATSRTGYDDEADALLENAIATRRAVLGPDVPETRGAELTLADTLFARWAAEDGEPDSALLERAAALLEQPFERGEPGSLQAAQARAARMLYGRIAFAGEDFDTAAAAFEETLPPPAGLPAAQISGALGAVYQEQVLALRGAGREEEASALLAAINDSLSGAPAGQ